jgi:hypothetical protein
MASSTDALPRIATNPNSLVLIEARVADGRISWLGPLLLVSARSFLLIASQGLVALILLALHHPSPWREAGYWWNIYGTLVDIGCLIGLRYFTRREGIRIRDLVGPIRLRHGRDVLVGLGYFALILPVFVTGGYFAQRFFYGPSGQNPGAYLFQAHAFPAWATIYALSIWWMIWSPTEEITYQGYALPRFKALTGRTWIAFVFVSFWWAVQHSALPFIPDARFVLFRFLAFLPGVLAAMTIYWRTRRLAPLIVAHWPMDIVGALMTNLH